MSILAERPSQLATSPPLCPALLTAADVAEMMQISKRTLSRLRAKGELPEPLHVSTNLIRWRADDIAAYLRALQVRKPRRRPARRESY